MQQRKILKQNSANLVCTFDLHNNYLNEDEPWSGILETTTFELQSMYDTTLKTTPRQLVLLNSMILNTPFIFD